MTGRKEIDWLGRTEKACSRCKEIKPLDAFGKCAGRKDRRHWRCLPCATAHNKEYNLKNLKRMQETSRRWRKAHPGYITCHSVGLPAKDGMRLYRKLREKQQNMCAICNRSGIETKLGFDP